MKCDAVGKEKSIRNCKCSFCFVVSAGIEPARPND